MITADDQPVDRDTAIAAWRRAEAVVYPSVMVNAALYQQYIEMVRAVVEQLRDVHTEADLVRVWHEQRSLGSDTLRQLSPSMAPLMNADALRDAAFCQRHREWTREHAKELMHARLEQAKRGGASWVLLFEDVTPFGSHRLEMHVRSGRAIHTSAKTDASGSISYELEVVQLDPRDGARVLDKLPLLPAKQFSHVEEWRARTAAAREQFGKD